MSGQSTCAPCGDSPLSITSNVIGLLTFTLATVATYLAYAAVALHVPDEIESHIRSLEGTRSELIPVLSLCEKARHVDHEAYQLHEDALESKLRALLASAEELAAELRALPRSHSHGCFVLQIYARLVWLRKRRSFEVRSELVTALKSDLVLSLLSLLTW